MSFRETSAWITLVTVLICFGAYFGPLVAGVVRIEDFSALHLLLGCVVVLVVLQAGLHALAARRAPNQARAPRDERERLIQSRSHTVGYYVLVVGVLALGVPGHMGFGPVGLMNFALLAVVTAAMAVSVAQIVMFRRGA